MAQRATVSFVATQILTSSDGLKHDEIKRIEPEGGGLQVRSANRDEEKLNQRGEGTSLTLYEQLQQNKDDKEEDQEAQFRESRLPKALDEEEVAFLEEQEDITFKARKKHIAQEDEDVAEFRAARRAFAANLVEGDGTSPGSASGSSSSSASLPSSATLRKVAVVAASKAGKTAAPQPRVVLKRKKRIAGGESGTGEGGLKRHKTSETEGINASLALISNYASSSDDE